jgi:sulfur carrier protein ThiS
LLIAPRTLDMRIHVRLHTNLRKETPEGVVDRLELELPEGATVAQAKAGLDLDRRARTVLTVVNGKIRPGDHVLADGDELRLVPAVSGGSNGPGSHADKGAHRTPCAS